MILPQAVAPAGDRGVPTFKTIMEFNRINGCNAYAGVAPLGSELYGTTTCGARFGNGGIYAVRPNGKWRLVHSFTFDGKHVYAPVTIVDGIIYGASAGSGKYGHGTVYSMDTRGKLRWLYSFKGAPDGDWPNQLVYFNGKFYGTTISGGTSKNCPYSGPSCGTVFEVSIAGKERVIYSFQGKNDGDTPWGGLTAVNGKLYGTTYYGGSNNSGIIFSVTTAGIENVLHTFGDSGDGDGPFGTLTLVDGLLYGTTEFGGSGFTGGTVFSISTSGQEKVVYSFGSGSRPDGINPEAGLLYFRGKLYGTTTSGGTGSCLGSGCGTVFSVTPSGQEQLLYSFTGGADGQQPQSQLAALGGVLYGTTLYGGAYYNYGTVFAVTP